MLIKWEVGDCITLIVGSIHQTECYELLLQRTNKPIWKDTVKENKIKLCTSFIRLMLTYGSDIWSTKKGYKEKHRLFERKILRKIYESVSNTTKKHGAIKINAWVYEIYKQENVIKFIKGIWLQVIGYEYRELEFDKHIY